MAEPVVDPGRVAMNWAAIAAEIEAPQASLTERILGRFGIPARFTRLVGATPALRRSWFLATGFAMLLALAVADSATGRDGLFTLLFVAPLVPVLGVSLAYGVAADPAHEVTLATSMSGLRLVVTRSVVVLTASIAMVSVATLLAPTTGLLAFAWLLPSLALTALTLAVMTFVSPRRAAIGVALGWSCIVFGARAVSDDRLLAFLPTAQFLWLLLLCVAVPVAVSRRDSFDFIGLDS